MTIKQQGGIFGRNPTFNDVEVEGTLTGSVSGNVTASSGSSSFQKIGIQNTSPTAPLTIGYSGAEAQIQINNSGGSRMFYAGAFNEDEGIVRLFNSSNVETVRIPAEATAGIYTYFNTGNVGIGTTSPSAKLSVSGGNISVDSGYGIDFSATSDASGSSSELLDDYEEGSCTLTLKGSTTDPTTPATTTGSYTKIGNLVHVSARWQGVDVTGAAGNISIDGLPYASIVYSAGSLYGSRASSSDIVIATSPSSSSLNVYDAGGNLVTWSSTGNVYWLIGISYKV